MPVTKRVFLYFGMLLLAAGLNSFKPTMDLAKAPKIELHLHLDCSLSYEVVKQLDPEVSAEEYRRKFVAPDKCTNLADYISRAENAIALMQTKEQLRLVTLDLFKQLQADNVIYAEIRFAPLQHTTRGLRPEEVVEIVENATQEGIKTTGIEAGIILCTLRHYSEAQSMETVKLVNSFKGTKVVGFDIAADEAAYPVSNHEKAFAFAHASGLNCTAHAGEAKGAGSVWETLQHFHPSRIGHGVRSCEDPELISFLKSQDIHLEICPTSNLQTCVFNSIQNHPADLLYRAGISMSINTDGRTISDVTLTDEYRKLHRIFSWEKDQFKNCNLAAIQHAFTTPEIKARLRKEIAAGYR